MIVNKGNPSIGIRLFQIKAPHFTAGFCVDAKNTVWKAAPILKWIEEKPLYFVDSYCKKKGWELISLGTPNDAPKQS